MCRGDIKIQYDVGAVVSVLIFGWGLFEATLFLRVIICNIRKELVGFCVRLMCTFNTVIRNIIYIIIVFRIVSFWNVHKGWKSLIRHQRIAKALIKAHWAMCCACVCAVATALHLVFTFLFWIYFHVCDILPKKIEKNKSNANRVGVNERRGRVCELHMTEDII